MDKYILILVLFIFSFGCKQKRVDTLIFNADIYAVDTTYANATAIAILDGKIVEVGSDEALKKKISDETILIDAQGNFLMPGFIEGHGHFSGLGYSLINLNFINSKSWEEIVSKVAEKTANAKPGDWIVGRGWHQEKWDSIPKQNIFHYPFHHTLSAVSPDNPVLLYHASGHSIYVNKKAMDLVGISKETSNPMGGEIIRDQNGDAIGVFEERAMIFFKNKYDEYIKSLDQKVIDSIWFSAIQLAEDECLSKGITSFQDAGSSFDEIRKYRKLDEDGLLKLRLWAMIRHPLADLDLKKISESKVIGAGNQFFTCNAIKSEVDGALGSFGAWLLEPYQDKPGYRGQNTTDIYDVKGIADIAINHDLQFCVHAIGDRANRVVLDIFEGVMDKNPEKNDLRWRIEHAQHLNPLDIPRFAKRNIIASMQGIHCTSDAPFVVSRLGEDRAKNGAYPWRSLLDNGVKIGNGTDAPVEDVDPIKSFYASVTRKRVDTGLLFFPEQKMTRAEAIYSYTKGNAYAVFEDKIKGSIRPGYVADIVILSNNLLDCSDDDILKTKVLFTIVDGKVKYKNDLIK